MTEKPQRSPIRHHQAVSARQSSLPHLCTKKELAELLRVSPRQIENWQAARVIPFIRIGKRCIRYSTERVLEALMRFEISEMEIKQQ